MHQIISPDNAQIKALAKLRRGGRRYDNALFLIDGLREIKEAALADWELEAIYFCPEISQETADSLSKLGAEKFVSLSPQAFSRVCYKENPDGVLAVAYRQDKTIKDIKLPKTLPLIVILEAIEKPGNLGAIIRTAKAASVDAVIVNDTKVDLYNPNVIRSSQGLIFGSQIIQAGREETIDWLKEKKIRSLAAATSAAKEYWWGDLDSPIALVLGSEAEGLSQEWLKAADEKLLIPMAKGVDSLNVSVSAGLLIYEANRQRAKIR